jgi:hypothetical protein
MTVPRDRAAAVGEDADRGQGKVVGELSPQGGPKRAAPGRAECRPRTDRASFSRDELLEGELGGTVGPGSGTIPPARAQALTGTRSSEESAPRLARRNAAPPRPCSSTAPSALV